MSALKKLPIEQICTLIANGASLKKTCKQLGISLENTRHKLIHSPEYAVEYARARQEQANYYADQIVEITDTERDPNRARVRVDARKWIASKMLPKVYGDMPMQTNVNVQNNVLVMGEEEQRAYQQRLKALREERRPDLGTAQLKIDDREAGEGGAPTA